MSRSRRRLTPVIGRWPRRVAALVCLLLAAGSALAGHRSPAIALPTTSARPTTASLPRTSGRPFTASLPSGLVAVPVALSAASGRYLHPGDRISLVAAPADTSTSGRAEFVADRVEILDVPPAAALDASPDVAVLLVATSRDVALRIAALGQHAMLAVLDDPP